MFLGCALENSDALRILISHGTNVIFKHAHLTANAMGIAIEDAVLAQRHALPEYLTTGAAMELIAIQIHNVHQAIVLVVHAAPTKTVQLN